MLDGVAGEGVDPETAGVKFFVRGGVLAVIAGLDGRRRQFTGAERIVNPLPCEGLDHAGGIADEEQTRPPGRQGGAG